MDTSMRTAESSGRADLALFRIGGMAGIAAGVLALIANVMHPRPAASDLGDTEKFLELVSGYGLWKIDHLAILLAVILGLIAFVAVGRSLAATPAAGLGKAAIAVGITTATVAEAFFALDGFVWSSVAQDWAEAGASTRQAVLERVVLIQYLDLALFSLTIMGLFGVNQILFGMALTRSGTYPVWIGWIAILGGILGVASGSWIWTSGRLGVGNLLILFTLASVLFTVWSLAASLRLLRLASGETTTTA